MLPLKVICDPKKIRRDGTSLLYIQYCYSSVNRTLLNTNIAIPPQYWNKKRQSIHHDLPAAYGDVSALSEELKRVFRLAEDLVLLAKRKKVDDPGAFVKRSFHPSVNLADIEAGDAAQHHFVPSQEKKMLLELFDQLDDYIASKEKKVSAATLTVFKDMKAQLKAFEAFRRKKITFDALDYNFYDSFVDFLTFDYVQRRRKAHLIGLKVNTIGKTIKQLRIFVKDRVRRKIILPIDLTNFKIPEEETDAIYLSFEEIGKIYSADLSKSPHLLECP